MLRFIPATSLFSESDRRHYVAVSSILAIY